MNELIALLIVAVLMLWLWYDRTKNPYKYWDPAVLKSALENYRRVLISQIIPALEATAASLLEFAEGAAALGDLFCESQDATNQ